MTHHYQNSDVMGVFFISFANAKRDLVNNASPISRLAAIKEKFLNLPCNTVFICASEYNRSQGGFSWFQFNRWMKKRLNFRLVQVSLKGDKSHTAFGNVIYVRGDKRHLITGWGEIDLVPSVQDHESWNNNKAAFVTIGDKRLVVCHLTLSFYEDSIKTKLLMEELSVVARLVEDDHTLVVGDFNLVPQMRALLRRSYPHVIPSLCVKFGSKDTDISFFCMPHDRVLLKHTTDECIVRIFSDNTASVVSALDVICGKPPVHSVTRFLPYGNRVFVPLSYDTRKVVEILKRPMAPTCDKWVSDHFPLFFEFHARDLEPRTNDFTSK